MAAECPLSTPLVLKDAQSGVVGETSQIWTIAPDCSYTIARQIGLKVLEPYKRGLLTSQQQARLKPLLDRMTAAALPQQVGGGPQVNARQITLSYAGKQTVLSLPPSRGDLSSLRAAAGDDATRLMLEIADELKALIAG
jgi:hypothetical protein